MMNQEAIDAIHTCYHGKTLFRGDMHEHAQTGGTSDGKVPLSQWKNELKSLNMDFAAILDHRQVRHMYLEDWDETMFLCGSEPGTSVDCADGVRRRLHYNMLLPRKEDLPNVLAVFPEFRFSGGADGHFSYPGFKRERLSQLTGIILGLGGMFTHAHPKQIMDSQNPLDYYFHEHMCLEVVYESITSAATIQNYALWKDLLARGKKVYASAGADTHNLPVDRALTTLYAKRRHNTAFMEEIHRGNFTAGSAAIRMVLNGQVTGSTVAAKSGDLLCIVISDVLETDIHADHSYAVCIWGGNEVIWKNEISIREPFSFSLPIVNHPFYRVTLLDTTLNIPLAYGNPIFVTYEP
ncbi:MAG TPA: hypothetical protein DCY74_10440 [Clostridiales bacterium]|nr:hypothetical protein [Clostridiales bacterium]